MKPWIGIAGAPGSRNYKTNKDIERIHTSFGFYSRQDTGWILDFGCLYHKEFLYASKHLVWQKADDGTPEQKDRNDKKYVYLYLYI